MIMITTDYLISLLVSVRHQVCGVGSSILPDYLKHFVTHNPALNVSNCYIFNNISRDHHLPLNYPRNPVMSAIDEELGLP